MTPKELESMEALLKAATPRPWTVDDIACVRDPRGEPVMTAPEDVDPEAWANACIIAAAPNALPALLRERKLLVEALRECMSAMVRWGNEEDGLPEIAFKAHDD